MTESPTCDQTRTWRCPRCNTRWVDATECAVCATRETIRLKPLRDMYDRTCSALGRAREEVDRLEREVERQRQVLIELGDTEIP